MSKINRTPGTEFDTGIPSGGQHIRCDVKNCTYHTTADCCSAGAIHVQSCTSADHCCNCNETACSTFVQKQ